MVEKSKMEREEIWESIDRLKLLLLGYRNISPISRRRCHSSISSENKKRRKEQAWKSYVRKSEYTRSMHAILLASYLQEEEIVVQSPFPGVFPLLKY